MNLRSYCGPALVIFIMIKRKILFAIGRLSVGGAEKLLVHQLRVINQSKFELFLLTLFPEQKESFISEVRLLPNRWKKFNFRSLFDLISWWKLYSYFRKERFDIVVTSLFSANLIVRLAAILAGIPVIISYEHNLYPDKHRWQIWADWLLAKWTGLILVDAESVREFTSRQEEIPKSKFKTLYIPPLLEMSGARSADSVRKELGIPIGAKVILTVSRLVEEKGHYYLIEAAKKVLSEFPDVYFVIVGWGPLEESLKLQIESFKLKDRVFLPGRMDIRDVLPLADIYAEPAVMTDLPIAIMEAMRLGKPIVATNIGEIPVFVRNQESGLLVNPKDSLALAEKIAQLLKDEELRKKFGIAAEKIVRRYSLEEYEKNFENLIKDTFYSS